MKPHIGIAVSPSSIDLARTPIRELVGAVVESGFTSLWSLDNPLADQAEPLVFLSAAAMCDERLAVGTAAIVGPVRDPILLAKQVATLDRVTGGDRVTLGLTIGRRVDEYQLIGYDFGRRGRLLADVVSVIKQCWAGTSIAVDGRAQSWAHDGPVGVPPATQGGPPILLGGLAPRALERAVRDADGYLGSATGGPEQAITTLARVHDLLAATSRPASDFQTVTNTFVVVADSRTAALDIASRAFADRHGGRPPPWDPADVVTGGPPSEVAEGVTRLVDAGYQAVTLVPVLGTIEQIRALQPVVAALSSAAMPAQP